MKIIEKPQQDEFSKDEPDLSIYIPATGLSLQLLEENIKNTYRFLLSVTPSKLLFKYQENKWTIKEIVSHMVDMERVYSYRILCISRDEKNKLPGFDDELYVSKSNANNRDIKELADEFYAVRKSTIMLLKGLSNEAISRTGIVNDNKVSARALAYHIAGHEIHHINIIKSRYL